VSTVSKQKESHTNVLHKLRPWSGNVMLPSFHLAFYSLTVWQRNCKVQHQHSTRHWAGSTHLSASLTLSLRYVLMLPSHLLLGLPLLCKKFPHQNLAWFLVSLSLRTATNFWNTVNYGIAGVAQSVAIVSDYKLDDRGFIPSKAKDFSSNLCVQTISCPPKLLSSEYQGFFPRE
jgi:hypothetical protein